MLENPLKNLFEYGFQVLRNTPKILTSTVAMHRSVAFKFNVDVKLHDREGLLSHITNRTTTNKQQKEFKYFIAWGVLSPEH